MAATDDRLGTVQAILLPYLRHFTYGAVFVLLGVAGLGVPTPQDLTLLLAGYLVQRGLMAPSITVPICLLGAVTGDALGFWLARQGAARLRKVRRLGKLLTSEAVARAQHALVRHAALTIAVARNVVGVRTVVFAAAAATNIPFARFLLWDFLAAIPNVALLLSLGYVFSNHLKTIIVRVSRTEYWIALGTLALAVAWFLVAWRNRRTARRTEAD